MAKTEFQRCLEVVLRFEGGYVNHPKDPGGATNKGITQSTYDVYNASKGRSKGNVRDIRDADVEAIYRRYWTMSKADMLPAGVNLAVFDAAINSGPKQSSLWLQRTVGVNADGIVGPATLLAVKKFGNDDMLVDGICTRRLSFMRALKTWKYFGKGWSARVNSIRRTGVAWASGAEAPSLALASKQDDTDRKAYEEDVDTPPSSVPGDVATGVGSASVVISQATDSLTPLSSVPFISKAVAVLTIVGVILAVGGIVYRAYAERKKKKLEALMDA